MALNTKGNKQDEGSSTCFSVQAVHVVINALELMVSKFSAAVWPVFKLLVAPFIPILPGLSLIVVQYAPALPEDRCWHLNLLGFAGSFPYVRT